MSSTKRGAKKIEHDYYVTDPGAVRLFLREWFADEPAARERLGDWHARILDPCAGGNQTEVDWEYKLGKLREDGTREPGKRIIVPPTGMSYPIALRAELGAGSTIHTNDIRPDSPAEWHTDFLSWPDLPPEQGYDLVITNPPFFIALEVIRRALAVVRPGGYVVMLLRLNFYGSGERFPFFQTTNPETAYVHSERMGFTPDGGQDSIEYQHAVWRRGDTYPRFTRMRVIRDQGENQ